MAVFSPCLALGFCGKENPPPAFTQTQDVSNCTACHSIRPKTHKGISCQSCHLPSKSAQSIRKNGNRIYHKDLLATPGNLSDAPRTCGKCHRDEVQGVTHSPMATNAAMIRKNRAVWNELSPKDKHFHVLHLDPKNRASDSYFSQLCANCHLNKAKTQTGPFTGYQKGGGCLACHLDFSKNGHPGIGRIASDQVCFSCHSRSGRISLSYRGLAELSEPQGQKAIALPDGRTVFQLEADVHFRAKMQCQDCHTAKEVMNLSGPGGKVPKARCEDCHLARPSQSRLLLHNGTTLRIPLWKEHHGHDPLHQRLDCASCHSRWAPSCFGCHIEFEPDEMGFDHSSGKRQKGRWQEYHGEYRASLPVLGVTKDNRIAPFVPGMKLSIDASAFYKEKARKKKRNMKKQKRLPAERGQEGILHKNRFVHLSPHTIGKARSCRSCHLSPEALGYGKGKIYFTKDGIQFQNEYEIESKGANQGIALDGWIRPGGQSKEGRSLGPAEQMRVLLVGKCLLEAPAALSKEALLFWCKQSD